jgi:uncharacterized protein YcfJ
VGIIAISIVVLMAIGLIYVIRSENGEVDIIYDNNFDKKETIHIEKCQNNYISETDNVLKNTQKGLGMKNVFYFVIGVVVFFAGYAIGNSKVKVKETVVYQPKTEYVKDPDAVSRSVLNSEVTKVKQSSYNTGYAEGLKVGKNEGHTLGYTEGQKTGIDEGYKSGYIQGTEYGKSLILDEIDLRVQESERTDKNVPLFRVKRK